jgi:hypothetical protein
MEVGAGYIAMPDAEEFEGAAWREDLPGKI